jgi:hypothetical protein|tara:strand:+ start:316 stop:699 length:384 start_codon:yes stop_codon:yes gene_type:complete
MINKYISIKSDPSDELFDRAYDEGIYFTMGPISIYQFNEFANFGINGLRLFQYIRTKQGVNPDKTKRHYRTWVHVENKNLYDWFGVHQSVKWELLKKMKEANLIDYVKRGMGKTPRVRIICPDKKLN